MKRKGSKKQDSVHRKAHKWAQLLCRSCTFYTIQLQEGITGCQNEFSLWRTKFPSARALSALAAFLSWWGPKTCLDTPNDRDHQKRRRFTQAWMKPGMTFILAVKDSRQGSNPESKPQLQNLHRQYLRINPPKVLNFACVSVFDGFKFPSSLWFCDLDSDAFTA